MSSILFVSLMNSDPWGGSEVQWFAFAKYCCSINKKVTCLMYDWDDKKKILEPLKELGAQIIYIPNKGRKKENIFQRLRFEWFTRFQQREFIDKFDFSFYDFVVVNQGGFMEVANSPWKNIYKRLHSYCLTFHNYTENFVFRKYKSKLLIEWISGAKNTFGASHQIKNVLEQQLNFTINNFNTLINPITIKISEGYSSYPPLFNGNYKFLMLAQLDVSRKAQDNLIEVFNSEIWRDRNVIIEFYGKGNDLNYLQNSINKKGLDKQIFLKGNTDNVSKVLDEAHLVLQITHRDAMPISVVEAMSKSRAVVVSNVGDMPIWVKENYNGWIASDASVNSIALVLEKAWQYRNNWEEMGKNAFKTFTEKYPKNVDEYFYKMIFK